MAALVALTAAVGLFTACMRDEDWDLLRHPIHVRGEVDPNFGVPVGYGKLTLNDILHMLSSEYTGHVNPDDDVITIFFDTVMRDTIRDLARSSSSALFANGGRKDGSGGITKDTVIRYGLDITLFDSADVVELVENNIEIGSLLLSVDAFIKADCPDTVKDIVREYVTAVVSDMRIEYVDHEGVRRQFTDFDFDPVPIDTLLVGHHVRKDDIEMRDIINSMPKHIEVAYDFHFELSSRYFAEHGLDPDYDEMMDSIGKLIVFYDAAARAEFPFDIRIGNLPYSFALNFAGDSIVTIDLDKLMDSIAEGLEVHLESSSIKLAFENDLPVKLNMAAVLLDSAGAVIGDTLVHHIIESARTAPMAGSDSYQAVAPSTTRLSIPLDTARVGHLKRTKQIGFDLAIATGDGAASGHTVAIRREDYLKIKVYLQLHPRISADVRVTDTAIYNR